MYLPGHGDFLSKLHPDDGGRVSVVSLAWFEGETIRSVAFPFAQGWWGKPVAAGSRRQQRVRQPSLFEQDDPNLDRRQWRCLCSWLASAGAGLVLHNAKFDLAMLRAGVRGLRADRAASGWAGIDLTDRVVWDTQIAAKELDPLEPSRLKGSGSVSERGWAEPDDEAQALKSQLGPLADPRYDLVDWAVMEPYARNDAERTARAHAWQVRRLAEGEGSTEGGSGWYWVRRETELMRTLARIEARGLPYDPAASRRAAQEAERRAEAIEAGLGLAAANLPDYWFGRGKDGQPVTVVDLDGKLRRGCGLAPYSTTPGGKPQVTAEVVAMMARDGIKGAAEYQRHRKLTTASQKWYRPYAAGTGTDRRLRTVYRQVAAGASGEGGTRSGRFSVERVNLQAIPHDYRLAGEDSALAGIPTPRQIIGRALGRLDGWEGWELDLAQAELRLAALWAGAEGMLALIRDGQDLHGATATALFGVRKGEQAWDLYRQVAKRANFSLIFGAGPVTFAGMVHRETGRELSGREAERIVAEWNQLYPQFRQAIDSHSRAVDYARPGARGANLANGRVRWFSSWEDTHKAFNQRVQASLAELGKDWMIESDRLGRELGLDRRGLAAGVGRAGLLITIHDSQVWLLPAGAEGERIAKQVADLGRASWARLFPGVPGEVDAKRWG